MNRPQLVSDASAIPKSSAICFNVTPWVTSAGDRHDVIAKLTRIGSGHKDILPQSLPALKTSCHQILHQTRGKSPIERVHNVNGKNNETVLCHRGHRLCRLRLRSELVHVRILARKSHPYLAGLSREQRDQGCFGHEIRRLKRSVRGDADHRSALDPLPLIGKE
jgi:hypothetical protein